jgi:hypothetical protein
MDTNEIIAETRDSSTVRRSEGTLRFRTASRNLLVVATAVAVTYLRARSRSTRPAG